MFPLESVVMPGALLPLHVFEPRYRQLVVDCLAVDGPVEFGQVLITHGAETGGGDDRSNVGTVVRALQVEALDASRYALVTAGVRRLRVNEWLPDDPYPRADVEDWPDVDDWPDERAAAAAIAAAHDRVRAILELAIRLDHVDAPPGDADVEIASDPVLATYHLATLAPIGSADRARLLAAPGPAARLAVLDDVLDDVEAMLRFRLS
jgi:hypothetical protein